MDRALDGLCFLVRALSAKSHGVKKGRTEQQLRWFMFLRCGDDGDFLPISHRHYCQCWRCQPRLSWDRKSGIRRLLVPHLVSLQQLPLLGCTASSAGMLVRKSLVFQARQAWVLENVGKIFCKCVTEQRGLRGGYTKKTTEYLASPVSNPASAKASFSDERVGPILLHRKNRKQSALTPFSSISFFF